MSAPSLTEARKSMLRLLALFPVPREGNRPCEVHNYLVDVNGFLQTLPAQQVELELLAARVSMLEAIRAKELAPPLTYPAIDSNAPRSVTSVLSGLGR